MLLLLFLERVQLPSATIDISYTQFTPHTLPPKSKPALPFTLRSILSFCTPLHKNPHYILRPSFFLLPTASRNEHTRDILTLPLPSIRPFTPHIRLLVRHRATKPIRRPPNFTSSLLSAADHGGTGNSQPCWHHLSDKLPSKPRRACAIPHPWPLSVCAACRQWKCHHPVEVFFRIQYTTSNSRHIQFARFRARDSKLQP